jgi:hypothetical protein
MAAGWLRRSAVGPCSFASSLFSDFAFKFQLLLFSNKNISFLIGLWNYFLGTFCVR